MLEAAGALKTWALDQPIAPGVVQPARRLPDHRLAYLQFEGDVSDGRGTVHRIDRGTYQTLTCEASRVRIVLQGGHVTGEVELTLAGDELDGDDGRRWWFRWSGNVDRST